MNQFFTSSSLELDYIDNHLPKEYAELAKTYILKMSKGIIPCTFNFLLKMFHYELSQNSITLPEYDILMLDEAGDTTGVSLEIFKLINAKKKIMVGDPDQNIYTFMNTINGFEILKNEGKLLTLSQSFRVSKEIAERVEYFCKAYFNSEMEFIGTTQENKTINTMAYLARTNSGLISRMMKLVDVGTPFNLLRSVDEIFELPLFLLKLTPKTKYAPHKFKYIFNEYQIYLQNKSLQIEYKSHYSYLVSALINDIQLKTAIALLRAHGAERIISTYNSVRNLPKRRTAITLATVHVAKGREWDEVYIEDDMNNCIKNIIGNDLNDNALTELRLAYVACTRGRIQLSNCAFL